MILYILLALYPLLIEELFRKMDAQRKKQISDNSVVAND